MKKKITATALALCLLLGLLPMSVLAAQYKGTLNGTEITIDVDDATGAVTLPSDLADHYSVSPGTLTVGSFPKSEEFTLTEHYGDAPGSIKVTGTLVEEEAEPVVTVEPTVNSDGTVTVQASDISSVGEETEKVVLDIQGNTSSGVTVNIEASFVTTVKDASVETVQVKTQIATTDVPVNALPSGGAKIEMKPAAGGDINLPADTADAVKTAVANATKAVSVTVKSSDGTSLFGKKESYGASDPIVTIKIDGLTAGKTYVVLCLGDDNKLTTFGRFANITETSISVRSKHLSAYIPVEETTENAAALAAVAADPGNPDATAPVVKKIHVTYTTYETTDSEYAKYGSGKLELTGLEASKWYTVQLGSANTKYQIYQVVQADASGKIELRVQKGLQMTLFYLGNDANTFQTQMAKGPALTTKTAIALSSCTGSGTDFAVDTTVVK